MSENETQSLKHEEKTEIETHFLEADNDFDDDKNYDIDYFKSHNAAGIEILKRSLPMLDSDKQIRLVDIINYLVRVYKWMLNATNREAINRTYETSMRAYEQAEMIINEQADFYQIQAMKTDSFLSFIFPFLKRDKPDYSLYVRRLCLLTSKLEDTMDFALVVPLDNPPDNKTPDDNNEIQGVKV